MTLSPTVPRFSERPASSPSCSRSRVTPKLALAACVPAIDWNTRSTGAPRSISWIAVVTWVSTQDWVGISNRWIRSSISRVRSPSTFRLSLAGLMPITASPQPYSSPSRIEAVMPAGSSVGWLGCRRTAMVPGRPMVLRNGS
jgi:hypothetical protein